jgi:hypothetical protein
MCLMDIFNFELQKKIMQDEIIIVLLLRLM